MLWWAAFYGNTRIPEIESKDATKKNSGLKSGLRF